MSAANKVPKQETASSALIGSSGLLDREIIYDPLQRTEFVRRSAAEVIERYSPRSKNRSAAVSKVNEQFISSVTPTETFHPPKLYHALKQLVLSLAYLLPSKLSRIVIHKL